MIKNKQIQKTIILIAMTIILSTLANASQIVQTPSAISDNMEYAFSMDDYYAIGLSYGTLGTYNSPKTEVYNPTTSTWTEVSTPETTLSASMTNLYYSGYSSKINGKIFLQYVSKYNTAPCNLANNWSCDTKIIEYNHTTDTWSIYRTINQGQNGATTSGTNNRGFACANQSTCWMENGSAMIRVYPNVTAITLASTYLMARPQYSNIIIADGGTYSQYWTGTGVSWNALTGISGASVIRAGFYVDTLHKYFCASTGGYHYNQTSLTYTKFITDGCRGMTVINDSQFIIQMSSGAENLYIKICSEDYPPICNNDLTTSTNTIASGEYNSNTGIMWLAGTNGAMFYYNASIAPAVPPSVSNFSVTTTPSSNPTVYGQTVNFNTIVSNSYTTIANTSVNITNSSGVIYNWYYTPLITGSYSATNSISGFVWTNIPLGLYNVTTTTYDGIHTTTSTFLWNVTTNATTNITTKNVTSYNGTTNYNQIYAITKINNNRLYSSGQNTTGHYIISYDITNPANIITKTKLVSESGTTFSEPTSISMNAGTLYLGTDDKLFVFTNANGTDATSLNQDAAEYGFGSITQRINDLIATNNGAWICQQGYFYDSATFYNRTNNDTSLTLSSTDPCKAVIIKDTAIFIRLDTSIKIYNLTTQALITTITGLSSPSGGARHDLMSISGNNLYTLSGLNNIRRYDITTISTPTYTSKCYTNYEAISLEAINDSVVIAGTQNSNSLRVCDYGDSSTYDVGTSTYLSNSLTTLGNTDQPYEIIKMDDAGKFAVAQNEKIGVYFYTVTTNQVSVNNPPTISSITTSTDVPCVNSTFQATIQASDPENDQLTYDIDCDGIQAIKTHSYITNQFTCSYTTSGTKTIKAWVSDGTATVLSTKSVTSTVCNTTNYLNFRIIDSLNPSLLLSGVIVNVVGQSSQISNDAGQAYFNLASSGTYTVTFSLNGYSTKTSTYTTQNGVYSVLLEPTSVGGVSRNQLQITVIDTNSNPIPFAIVSATDPVTAIAKISQADSTGLGTIFDLSEGVELRISAGKTGYITKYDTTILSNGETKAMTITLLAVGERTIVNNGRACSDYIDGIVLCSPLNTTGTGDTCSVNTDCITGRCEPTSYTCSKFNWTICDSQGLERGNKCFNSVMAGRAGENTSNWILDNFLYVLAFVAVTIFIMMIIKSIKN